MATRTRTPIGLTADLHCHEHAAFAQDEDGFNSRLMDAKRAVLYMAGKVEKEGGRTLIIAGDSLHSRKNVSVAVLHVLSEAISEAKERHGVRVCTFYGNHDMSLDGRALSILGLPFAEVWEEPGVYDVDGWRVGVIPWTEAAQTVESVLSRKADFYVGHFGVKGAKVGPSDFEIPGSINASDLVSANSKAPIFLGHYHKPQAIPGTHALYVGSPMQLSWGEAGEEKRFIIMREDGYRSIPLTQFPRFMRVGPDEIHACREIDFVEVVVKKAEEAKRARNIVKDKHPTAHVIVDAKPKDAPVRVDLVGLSLMEQIDKWVESTELPENVTPKLAKQVARELLGGI